MSSHEDIVSDQGDKTISVGLFCEGGQLIAALLRNHPERVGFTWMFIHLRECVAVHDPRVGVFYHVYFDHHENALSEIHTTDARHASIELY